MFSQQPMEALLKGSRRKTAILDANLLLLWVSSRPGVETFVSFKRIKPYSTDDLRLLSWLLGQFRSVVTTSGVLAEVSNLANELSGELRDRWFAQLASFAVETDEVHVSTQQAGRLPELVRFGFTDAVLAKLSKTHVLITAEYRLAGYLEKDGRQVVNFNNLRPLWLSDSK